jgi:hypothetical protein
MSKTGVFSFCIFVECIVLSAILENNAFADPAITTGSAKGARDYYVKTGKLLGVQLVPGTTTVSDVSAFLGYDIPGEKLESLEPAVLMSAQRLEFEATLKIKSGDIGDRFRDGDILASRFFAPKIVNVSKDNPTPGWRKLIRLRARANSAAARSRVESAIILFNFVVPATNEPFRGRSFNTQAMLLAASLQQKLYWLDFDSDQKLTLALNASFDAADLKVAGNHDYFVPDGCNACHGSPGNYAPPMVNYLDTDHWFDRVNEEDDFKDLKRAGTALVFDAKTNDPKDPAFSAAFDVVRRFNEEALRQNNLVRTNSFESEAARTWLRIHAQSDEHFPPIARAFALNGGTLWQPSEAEALGKLNRYCFRCHGSVHFSIFDRPTVLLNAGGLQQHIRPNPLQSKKVGFKMPPDRELDPQEIQALYDFLGKMK